MTQFLFFLRNQRKFSISSFPHGAGNAPVFSIVKTACLPIMASTILSMPHHITTQKLCNWFIQKANEKNSPLTPVKLNHLVILADWWYLHRNGESLISEEAEAWPQGPVLPSIYHEYKDQPSNSAIDHPSRRQPPLEPETDAIPFLEAIWNFYGRYTARQLVRINTSPDSPWKLAQGRQDSPERQHITKEYVEEYFRILAD